MSSYKLEFTLKQHTPIIHFQADQKGATLRATELKPKLDKFLIENAFNNDFEKYKSFLIGYKEPKKSNNKKLLEKDFKGKKSFDYKVKIEPDNSMKKNITRDSIQLYFAGRKPKNVNDSTWNNNKKYFKIRNLKFKITILVFNSTLSKNIETYFSSFIFQTNFGTRQTKGFGSFIVLSKDINLLPKNLYKFNIKSQDYQTSIYYFYKMLRSGINEYNKSIEEEFISIFYGKSLLWLYAKEKDGEKWTWDKKAIKQSFFNSEIDKESIKHNNSNILTFNGEKQYLLRDLMGLSTEESWLKYHKTFIKKDKNLNEKKEPIISRFKSPIQFKPIKTNNGFDIYFWGNEIPNIMLNNTFKITIKNNPNSIIKELTPPNDFSIYKYLSFIYKFAKDKRLSKHIDSTFHKDPARNIPMPNNYRSKNIYNILDEVFSSIEEVKS